jgi:hypothetical protein
MIMDNLCHPKVHLSSSYNNAPSDNTTASPPFEHLSSRSVPPNSHASNFQFSVSPFYERCHPGKDVIGYISDLNLVPIIPSGEQLIPILCDCKEIRKWSCGKEADKAKKDEVPDRWRISQTPL